MRRKMEAVLCFESSDDGLPRIVHGYRARYRAVSQVLDDNPEILSAVHKDIQKLSEGDSTGRESDYTSENILRALIVQHTEGLPDCESTESVIDRQEKLFGTRPEVVAADKGFCPAAEKFKELAERVDMLAIPRRMQDFMDKVLAHWQAFRAGIEGTISGLKRAFRLIRCFFLSFLVGLVPRPALRSYGGCCAPIAQGLGSVASSSPGPAMGVQSGTGTGAGF
jgi:hypothetical protein